MSHSKSLGSPVGSKASLIGADPDSLHDPLLPADATTGTASEPAARPLLDQAKRLLSKQTMTDLLPQLPAPVKEASTKAVARFNQLSTTEKVVGGVLLVLGVRYLLRSGKKSQDQQAETLHELLPFVNDRVAGYQKAAAESHDASLRSYYQQLAKQSQQFADELNAHLRQLGEERETSTTLKGKLYRRLMEATAAVTGHDEKAILATNIHGEQWAIAAYQEALEADTLRGGLQQAVTRQYAQSERTLKELKRLETSR